MEGSQFRHHFFVLAKDCQDILRLRLALDSHHALDELRIGHHPVLVFDEVENVLGLRHMDLQQTQHCFHLRITKQGLELVKTQHAIPRRVCLLEERQQFVSHSLFLCLLFQHRGLVVLRCQCQGVPQEQGSDDAEHGEDHSEHVNKKEHRPTGVDLLDEWPGVIGPTPAECELEDAPESPRWRAEIPEHPLPVLLGHVRVLVDFIQALAKEQRAHQHHQNEQQEGPE
mmetsp:Transcript_86652/g.265168  ORF Transcript_86652/g.265168 Transcript_86652/m.265168 type:complete len:227 (-) Transcript_86652:613-1293(-)